MPNFTVKLTVKWVIYSQINCKMRYCYFENFEAKTVWNWVGAILPPKFRPQKIIGLQLN